MKKHTLSYLGLNLLFILDAAWLLWAIASAHVEQTLPAKFLLCFILWQLLSRHIKLQPVLLTAVLFCLCGDVLLQPLDMNYTDLGNWRWLHFVLGVLCFCCAYGSLGCYYLKLNPDWRAHMRAQPATLLLNSLVTVPVLLWMSCYNQASPYLLLVLWLYSPIVVGSATLAMYTRKAIPVLPWVILLVGSNCLIISDTAIGLTAFTHTTLPWMSNPLWILSSYILGIFAVFNAILLIERQRQ